MMACRDRAGSAAGAGVSGVRYVQSHQEAGKPRRAKPFQVVTRRGYLCRVRDPQEGVAVLRQRLAAGDLPQGRARVREVAGLWEVSLVCLGRGQGRRRWLRHFACEADAVAGLQDMRAVSDRLERENLQEALRVLESLLQAGAPD